MTMPRIEVFRVPEDYALTDDDGSPLEPGWYYWPCLPGCLPDGDAMGPAASAASAEADARDAYADDDDPDDDRNPDSDADADGCAL